MGLLVTALTVALAVANHALLRVLRTAMQHIQALAGAFVLLSGLYLLYYFWVVDVQGESGAAERGRARTSRTGSRTSSTATGRWSPACSSPSCVAAIAVRRRPTAPRRRGVR